MATKQVCFLPKRYTPFEVLIQAGFEVDIASENGTYPGKT
jgi:hypothetical protein